MKLYELQSPAEVTELEQQLDNMFKSLGLDVQFSSHFIERILSRERRVTIQEVVQAFAELKKKYKQRLLRAKRTPEHEAILKDFDHDLNIVFAINGPKLTNITIKRKSPDQFVANAQGGEEYRVGRVARNENQ